MAHAPVMEAATTAEAGSRPWPKPSVAWYAVWVFAIALMFGQLDQRVITLLVGPIKTDLHLTDTQMSFLLGIAVVIFNAIIAVPLSRFVDIWQRNLILCAGITVWGVMTSLCGLAQNFWQLFVFRMGIGVGGLVHGPATYSMMADYFPREKLPRAIAILQIGYICGGGIALILGAFVIQTLLKLDIPPIMVPGIGQIRNWQLVFILVGVPSILVAGLMLTVPEPPRRRLVQITKPIPLVRVIAHIWKHKRLFAPQFLGLAVSAVELLGTQAWQPEFFSRTFDWSAQKAGFNLGLAGLIAGPIGLLWGTWLTEHLAKTRNDANLRVVAICYTINPIFLVAAPLMPNPWMAILCIAISGMFGIAGAVPQNAALQSVTPNEMRGQVTAMYLFIFAVIGAGIGPTFIALITDFIFRDEQLLHYAMASSAAIMTPIAAWILWQGVKPYGEAIAEIKERERKGLL